MKVKITKGLKIRVFTPQDVFRVMKQILIQENRVENNKEHLWFIGLATNNRINYIEYLVTEPINETTVVPREIFRFAVIKGCARVIMVQNRLSDSLLPSVEDLDLTSWLVQAGLVLNVPVEDYVIINAQRYLSLREHGVWDDIVDNAKYKPKYIIEQHAEKKRTLDMAREMKAQGIETAVIAKVSGLTEEEIQKL